LTYTSSASSWNHKGKSSGEISSRVKQGLKAHQHGALMPLLSPSDAGLEPILLSPFGDEVGCSPRPAMSQLQRSSFEKNLSKSQAHDQ
jgi:hypothetical protein